MTLSQTNAQKASAASPTTYGGWSPFQPLSAEDRSVFNEAISSIVGVKYTPLLVSQQIVNGINYRFQCEAQVESPEAPTMLAMVEVYKPLHAKAMVTHITTVLLDAHFAVPGGWSSWGPIKPESQKVFREAMHDLLGVDYTPLEVSTQVVAGMNYRFLTRAQMVVPESQPYYALVQIYQPLNGAPIITDIKRIG